MVINATTSFSILNLSVSFFILTRLFLPWNQGRVCSVKNKNDPLDPLSGWYTSYSIKSISDSSGCPNTRLLLTYFSVATTATRNSWGTIPWGVPPACGWSQSVSPRGVRGEGSLRYLGVISQIKPCVMSPQYILYKYSLFLLVYSQTFCLWLQLNQFWYLWIFMSHKTQFWL